MTYTYEFKKSVYGMYLIKFNKYALILVSQVVPIKKYVSAVQI